MLADDLHAHRSIELKPGCSTCNGYNAERITIPNVVIMDEVLDPTLGLEGKQLAEVVIVDDRITSRTAARPTPGRPTSRFTIAHLMQRAVDMRNMGLIPFTPFGSHVVRDDLRSRPLFIEWAERYRADLPATSVHAAPEPEQAPTGNSVDGLMAQVDEAVPSNPGDSYPRGGSVAVVNAWIGQNQQRARFAEVAEARREKGPRKGVIGHVQTVLTSQ